MECRTVVASDDARLLSEREARLLQELIERKPLVLVR